MKKKLKIDQLKVQSFVTSTQESAVRGGGSGTCYLEPTNYSCLDYISCNRTACVIRSWEEPCVQSAVDLCQ